MGLSPASWITRRDRRRTIGTIQIESRPDGGPADHEAALRLRPGNRGGDYPTRLPPSTTVTTREPPRDHVITLTPWRNIKTAAVLAD